MRTNIVILTSPEMKGTATRIADDLNRFNKEMGGVDYKHYELIEMNYRRFPNGEIVPCIPGSVRSKAVYLLESLFHPNPNEALMRLFLTLNAVRLASAQSITIVAPYIPYLRQDRKDKGREPISARVIANLIETNKLVKSIITFDMHVEQEEGFFNIPVDNIPGRIIHAEYILKHLVPHLKEARKTGKLIVIAPDFGGATRAKRFAKLLGNNVPVAILEKERKEGQGVVSHKLIGENPKGKIAILYDDMIDTGNTTIASVAALRARGAQEVFACATHAIFSPSNGTTVEKKFGDAKMDVIVTNTIPRDEMFALDPGARFVINDIAPLLAKIIHQSECEDGSVSKLIG